MFEFPVVKAVNPMTFTHPDHFLFVGTSIETSKTMLPEDMLIIFIFACVIAPTVVSFSYVNAHKSSILKLFGS